MKSVERNKAQKLVDKIQTGIFDENDIDSIFIKLRAYCAEFTIFREVADFVAHNDLRDRGISNQALETMYLRMKYFVEYNSPQKPLDISKPFPLWIKRLMLFQVDKTEEQLLREKFNVTRQRLKTRIDNSFKVDKSAKLAIYKDGKLSMDTIKAIQHVMSFISGGPSFTQKDLMLQLVGVLDFNRINYDKDILQSLSDKITVCTLLLFHKSEFDFKGYKRGYCEIAAEKESVCDPIRFVGADGKIVEHEESFGTLSVRGRVTLDYNGKDLSILHCIMSTELDAEKWCSESLFHRETHGASSMFRRLKLDDDLSLDKDFRLTSVTP